ncbi:MAG TPA: NRDE family protein [Patescibacteria group bacterium]|nr:NRDE family protein [Patescibacteria group bacterium]
MCLIALALNVHPRYRLVLAANRDEFHARPAAAAAFHDDAPDLFGGRDLQGGGSWLLASRSGRVVAVTNVRTGEPETGTRSRGELVRRCASGDVLDRELQRVQAEGADYGRFNLLAFEHKTLWYAGNHPDARLQPVPDGVHGLSNASLNTPWPKTDRLRKTMATWSAGEDDIATLFDALSDPRIADDHALPSTGIPREWERRLSAAFITGEDYGTRASTLVLVADDHVRFIERRFGPQGVALGHTDQIIERR